jgi:hypothetical protein
VTEPLQAFHVGFVFGSQGPSIVYLERGADGSGSYRFLLVGLSLVTISAFETAPFSHYAELGPGKATIFFLTQISFVFGLTPELKRRS